ncbi:ABC transporter permease [Paenarthrobacter ureafaciens]|uniref:ABC transporter permease n=1 Tax=Paenarthrobacter ureafaciens TaxID=37931 RepID=UPI002DBAB700|nr:ABC transporter permease [Paenarthrobacter ureafaciens]MEC3853140.1 ABC transporter permease [Paenarthrobacter ureafaciens]
MARFLLRRALQSLLTLMVASVAVFALMRLIPGDPAVILSGGDASDEGIAATRTKFGLDQPLPVQYWLWVAGIIRGDLGTSFSAQAPVSSLIEPTIPATLWLVSGGVLLAVVVALLLGAGAAVSPRRGVDAFLTGLASLLYGAPVFWLALIFILFFGVQLKWLPVGGFVNPADDPALGLSSLILPWLVLGLAMGASLSKFVRAAFLETLESDHVRLARAKGGSTLQVISKHVFRNAMVPVVTVFGVSFATLLGGAVVLEAVFTWPGLGSLMINSVNNRDYPTVQAVLLIYVGTFVMTNFLTDVSYSLIDPRIRLSGGA